MHDDYFNKIKTLKTLEFKYLLSKKFRMDIYTKYIIQKFLILDREWIYEEDIRKIHNEVWDIF
jgi:hypothetical protein